MRKKTNKMARGIMVLSLVVNCAYGAASHAATYYVATGGDDTRNVQQAKAESTPWRTIQKAVDTAGAGDTILVAAGTYQENVSITEKHGKEGAWITLKARDEAKPKIVGKSNAEGYGSSIEVNKSSYIEVRGFDLMTPGINSAGISVGRSHHVRVADCIAHDNGQSGISTGWSDYLFIENNIAYNNSFTGIWHGSGISLYQFQESDKKPGFHNIVRGNICYNNMETDAITSEHTDGNGIIIDDFHNTQPQGNKVNYAHATLVENNLCYSNGAKGIQVYLSDNVTVRNNTCYWNNRDSGKYSSGTWRGELNLSMSSNCTFVNNIGVANTKFNKENTAMLIAALASYKPVNNVFKNNLTFNGKPGDSSVRVDLGSWPPPKLVTKEDGNLLGVDPQFVRPDMGRLSDFTLQPGSPAIGAGLNMPDAYATDLNGKPRVNAGKVDIGAYAFVAIKKPVGNSVTKNDTRVMSTQIKKP